MYVCLCVGATNQTVCDAVARGASTSKEVADVCGAGGDCGRCRRTLRAIIAASRLSAAQLDPTRRASDAVC
ncbi:(2Fe-2S)-binding protein [Mycobacterium decipiens]|uniref:Bacterioferritin-associated ferredoxin n=1 Tax=Mycobacterium decipiens TaxID=1430326 RepID=A0A1X2LSJ2_9MYCO|nr:(2Fe-2S)-binding protein [Mycobacterium decipiens]OSC39767.1 (2Fe-2S)-binding protein [Mycobacterium decipiens]